VGEIDGEDVAQDALLLAFRALPTIEEPRKFAAWLSAITRHRAFRFSRNEKIHLSNRLEMDELLLERIQALGQPLAESSEGREVMERLAELPEEYALPMRLRFVDEMPVKRIAGFMGLPLSTVKWRLHQGKKLMKEKLG
jgi:RNA polymerase sigma-70 factor (ECF subfamily)